MGKRGPKPKGKVKIKWSSDFAYAIGLLATDGCVSGDGRHTIFVSKDLEQVCNFVKCLGLKGQKIGQNISGYNGNRTHRVQFSDKVFVGFLLNIGISPAKSKTIGEVKIPAKYFFDFLRGCFDGDGSIYSYWDKRWRSSFMFYVSFVSASKKHVEWLRSAIFQRIHPLGHITKGRNNSVYQLKYAKADSILILRKMYHNKRAVSLSRKRLKIKRILAIVNEPL